MLRWIIIGLVVFVALKAVGRLLAARSSARRFCAGQGKEKDCSEMVRCEQCGTFVLKSSARQEGGAWMCQSHEH